MTITELKSQTDFFIDAIYQKGYDLGFESVTEELEAISDRLWNDGLKEAAETIRGAVRVVRAGSSEENL
jgi:hypothetical protein